jgi:hypothetical protein
MTLFALIAVVLWLAWIWWGLNLLFGFVLDDNSEQENKLLWIILFVPILSWIPAFALTALVLHWMGRL